MAITYAFRGFPPATRKRRREHILHDSGLPHMLFLHSLSLSLRLQATCSWRHRTQSQRASAPPSRDLQGYLLRAGRCDRTQFPNAAALGREAPGCARMRELARSSVLRVCKIGKPRIVFGFECQCWLRIASPPKSAQYQLEHSRNLYVTLDVC